jgi:D-mannonate dehydratase
MKLGLLLPATPDRRWTLAAQGGVTRAVSKLLPPHRAWERDSLAAVQKTFAEAGFTLCALEGDQLDMSRIKLGLPGRDEDIETYIRLLHAMGELGIGLLCYNFMAGVGWYRSRTDLRERGGALTSGFFASDVPEKPLELDPETLWANYEYFIRAVLPEAEKAGVKMGLHPDDPPVDRLLGFPRIFGSASAFRRAMALTGSRHAGITFCVATFRTMGEDVSALLKEFREQILFVHLRDNLPMPGGFRETFHDNGPSDMPTIFALFKELALDVLLRPDHAPTMEGEDNADPGYAAMGRILGIAYFKGIMDAMGMAY